MLQMEDESGPDAKILAVPIDKLCTSYRQVKTMDDMNPMLLAQIAHFFEHYKDLEANKWVKVSGWVDGDAVAKEINDSIDRYQQSS